MEDSTRLALENSERLKVLYELAEASYGEVESAYQKENKTTFQVWLICLFLMIPILYLGSLSYFLLSVLSVSFSLALLSLTRETRRKENIRNLNIQFTPEIKKVLSLINREGCKSYIGKEYFGFNWDGRLILLETLKILFREALYEIQDNLSHVGAYKINVYPINKTELLITLDNPPNLMHSERMEYVCKIIKDDLKNLNIEVFEGPTEVFTRTHKSGIEGKLHYSKKFSILKNSFVVKVA